MSVSYSLSYESFESFVNSLEDIINYNKTLLTTYKESIYDASNYSHISIKSYMTRVINKCEMELGTFIYAIKLLNKFCFKTKFHLTEKNCYKLIFVCMLEALKMNEDFIFSDEEMARFGCLKLSYMIALEDTFLKALDYDVYIRE